MKPFLNMTKQLWFLVFVLIVVLVALCLSSCSNARGAHNPQGERIFTDQAGYVCFAIRDEDGKISGGNCLKE